MSRVFEVVDNVGRVLRAMLGVPDYDRYIEHCQLHHPGTQPLSPEEFSADLLERKYSRPGARCC